MEGVKGCQPSPQVCQARSLNPESLFVHILPTTLGSPTTAQGMAAGHLQRTQREGIHVRHDLVPHVSTEEGDEDGRRVEIFEALREDTAIARTWKCLLDDGE